MPQFAAQAPAPTVIRGNIRVTYTAVSGGKVTFNNLLVGGVWLYYNATGLGADRIWIPATDPVDPDNDDNRSYDVIQLPACSSLTVRAKDTDALPSYQITIEARGFGDEAEHTVAAGALEFTLNEGVTTARQTIPAANNGQLRLALGVNAVVHWYDDADNLVNEGAAVAQVFQNIQLSAMPDATQIAFTPEGDGFATVNAVQDD